MTMQSKTAVALGSFDGLHKGHISVIACALSFRECGLVPYVLLFDSHPLLSLTGKAPPKILQDGMRDSILESIGIKTKTISFKEIMNLTCREFFEEILIKKFNAGAVCCGENYRFGRNNEGGCETLRALCNEYNIELKISESVDYQGLPVSSTRIRQAIEGGEIPSANAMLSREFCYKLKVVSGDRRGRLIGAPTINQHFDENFVIPKIGVYASASTVDGVQYPSVTNIGLRPSFANADLRSETCLLGFSGDLYGRDIEVKLLKYLRPEIKFDSMEALGAQIRLDAAESENIFKKRGDGCNV